MERKNLTYLRSMVSYLRFGTGERFLFALHGYGDSAMMWLSIQAELEKKFTVIALDLPFHGATDWREPEGFHAADFEKIILEILKIERIDRFSLAGFSFGARIVEVLFIKFPQQIDQILLFSPDGFGTKGLSAATYLPHFWRRIAAFFLKNAAWLPRVASVFFSKKGRNSVPFRFLKSHFSTAERRARLFAFWLSFDDFAIMPSIFKAKLKEMNVPTDVYCGTIDQTVPLSIIRKNLADGSLPNVQLHVFNGGHRLSFELSVLS